MSRHAGGRDRCPVGSRLSPGHARTAARCSERAAQLAHLWRHLQQSTLYDARSDHAGKRRATRVEVGLSVAPARSVRDDPARRRRHSLHGAGKRRRRARCGVRPAVLDVPPSTDARCGLMLRAHQPRCGDTGRNNLPGRRGRAPGRPRREDRQTPLGCDARQSHGRLFDQACAARHQEQSHCRDARRRVWHPRIHRGTRRGDAARNYGDSTPLQDRASPAAIRGEATRGCAAADPSG